jgi:hypothetical protein
LLPILKGEIDRPFTGLDGSRLRLVSLENTCAQQHPEFIPIDPLFGIFSVLHSKITMVYKVIDFPFTSLSPILDRDDPAPVRPMRESHDHPISRIEDVMHLNR